MDQKERDEKVAELKRRGVQPEEVCHLTDEVAEKCRRQDPEIEALLDQLSEEQNHASSGGGKIVDQKRSDRRTVEELTRLYWEPEIVCHLTSEVKEKLEQSPDWVPLPEPEDEERPKYPSEVMYHLSTRDEKGQRVCVLIKLNPETGEPLPGQEEELKKLQ